MSRGGLCGVVLSRRPFESVTRVNGSKTAGRLWDDAVLIYFPFFFSKWKQAGWGTFRTKYLKSEIKWTDLNFWRKKIL